RGIDISCPNVTIKNCKLEKFRQDDIVINHKGSVEDLSNIKIEHCYLGTVGRNCLSLIAGREIYITGTTFYLDESVYGASATNNGYLLFDLEPDNQDQISKFIYFDDVTFISNTT